MTVVILTHLHPSIRCSTAFRDYSGCSLAITSGETFSQNQNAISIPNRNQPGFLTTKTPRHKVKRTPFKIQFDLTLAKVWRIVGRRSLLRFPGKPGPPTCNLCKGDTNYERSFKTIKSSVPLCLGGELLAKRARNSCTSAQCVTLSNYLV